MMSLTVNRAPPLDRELEHSPQPGRGSNEPPPADKPQWPAGMVTCMRQHLSVGICDGILESCSSKGGFSPSDWKTSSRRKSLIAYVCKRASFFTLDAHVHQLQDALELAAYAAWRRSDSAKLPPKPTSRTGGSTQPSTRTTPPPSRARALSTPTSPEPPPRRAASSSSHAAVDADAMAGCRPNITISVTREADVLSARTRALSVAGQAGASLFVRTRIATLVSELARRIQQSSAEGRIELHLEHGHLVVTSHDNGPVIEKLDAVLAFPSRHREGPAAALAVCKSLAKDFSGTSRPGMGTTLIARLPLR